MSQRKLTFYCPRSLLYQPFACIKYTLAVGYPPEHSMLCCSYPFVSLVSCADVPQTYTERGNLESNEEQRRACRFSKSLLGSCSGENDPTYGFSKGKPCIIVKLNRIVNYRPQVGLLPTTLQSR